MHQNDTARQAARTLLESDTHEPFVIARKPKNLWEWILFKLRPELRTKTFQIRPLLVGNRIRIAERGINFTQDVFEHGIGYAIMHGTMAMTEDTIYIAAVAIQNDRNEPSSFLLEELRWVDDKTLAMLVDQALSQVDIENFMQPIILISGTNVLKKMSPTSEEMIAS